MKTQNRNISSVPPYQVSVFVHMNVQGSLCNILVKLINMTIVAGHCNLSRNEKVDENKFSEVCGLSNRKTTPLGERFSRKANHPMNKANA